MPESQLPSPTPDTSFGQDFNQAEANYSNHVYANGLKVDPLSSAAFEPVNNQLVETTMSDESPLARAQRLSTESVDGEDYDHIFTVDGEPEAAVEALSQADRELFNRWKIDKAGHSPPNLWRVIAEAEKDEYGGQRLSEEQVGSFKEALGAFGFLAEKPSEAAIQEGIDRANRLIATGNSKTFLFNLDFFGGGQVKSLVAGVKRTFISWDPKNQLFVDSKMIQGASAMEDWTGKSHGANKSWDKDGKLVTGPSINAIEDYAARDTQLPALERGALWVILTKEGVKLYSGNGAHRTAAAKLRGGEPLGFSSIAIYDAR